MSIITSLSVLFTADTSPVIAAAKKVRGEAEKIEKKPVKQTIDGDAKGALAAMGRVEAEGKKIVSAKTVALVDANIEKADASLERVKDRLEYLRATEVEMGVTADVKRAERELEKLQRRRDGLVQARESMVIDADTAPAADALGGLEGVASDAGEDAGVAGGKGLGDALAGTLTKLGVAGAVIGAAVMLGKGIADALVDGMQVEVRQDRLEALTGITEQQAFFFARQAGESYTQGFGESIEANMDTARLALQSGLLDPTSTRRDTQAMVNSLAGIADVLGEDVRPVATAVTTLLRSGVVKSSKEAFDLIATGAREGVNLHEDLLDTLTEYPALFSRLGLSGADALGLINQGLKGGARNSDLAADALKEFQIRATDASESSAEGFRLLGLDAEDMTAKIASGGERAREGLGEVLDGLRDIEDPVARNAAAVALFGTQAEDLGDALYAMDLSTAVDELNGVTGAAQRMFDTLADNDASKIEQAQRNIEVAADGIKGALAAAFSEPLGNFADWVSENRGQVMEFILGLVDGAIGFGISMVNGIASATESIGDFTANVLPPLINAIAGALDGIDRMLPGSQGAKEFREWADGAIAGIEDFDAATERTADNMRNALLPGLEGARDRFREFAEPTIDEAYLNDAMLRVASAVERVGEAADGAQMDLSGMDTASIMASESGALLEAQVRAAVSALADEAAAAATAGEEQDALTERYQAGREALAEQLTAMGLTEEQAWELIGAYSAIPEGESTDITSNASERTVEVDGLAHVVRTLPDGSVTIEAVDNATSVVNGIISRNSGRTIYLTATAVGGRMMVAEQAQGHVVVPMAAGGLTPMPNLAQKVPANTWRVVGDRMDVPELYAPLDGSARSAALIAEAIRLWPGGWPGMDQGGLTRTAPSQPTNVDLGGITVNAPDGMDVEALAEAVMQRITARIGGL